MRALIVALPILIAFAGGYLLAMWRTRDKPELPRTQRQELEALRDMRDQLTHLCALHYHEPFSVIVMDQIKATKEIQK